MGYEKTPIDGYISAAPTAFQPILQRIREIVRRAAPEAAEIISYRMPAFRGRGIILYFAAFRDHIGLYPPVHGDARLEEDLARYRGPKGNLRFPVNEPMPYALIKRVAELRARQDRTKRKPR
ncbi:MAG TPA: DUF1801 domain-containing protein [Caulobacteraceae bacterium]|jgi:uncharacterized protein YdhG (YjbR/CyaY superfamily)|nr:DUF1801 domain-containing protein [Caulobacteraceae bacterium]